MIKMDELINRVDNHTLKALKKQEKCCFKKCKENGRWNYKSKIDNPKDCYDNNKFYCDLHLPIYGRLLFVEKKFS